MLRDASFGLQSSGALFGANNASTSAPSTTPASTDSGFNFGSSGPLTFGAGSSAASGGAAAAAPTFGAPQQNAGGLLSFYQLCLHFCTLRIILVLLI